MYQVGQVIYTVSEKNHKVIPLKVVEQVITKTLEGELTEYTVCLPSNKDESRFNLKRFKKIYNSLEELKKQMILNANTAIDKMIKEGSDLEEEFFKKDLEKLDDDKKVEDLEKSNDIKEKSTEIINDKKSYKSNDDNIKIDLGNGQVGKINLTSIKEKLGK